jgi:hypothetical protein
MKRLLLGSILLALPVALTGCLAAEDRLVGRPLDVADVPDTFSQVRLLEERGLKELRTGNKQRNERRRREHMDSAMAYFREARNMYVDELIHDPGTPDEQEYLEREIERLGDLIDHVHRLRPLGS